MNANQTRTKGKTEEVFALNVDPSTYAQIFEEGLPKNLGIGLVALAPMSETSENLSELAVNMVALGMTLRALFEYEEFCLEFAPDDFDNYVVVSQLMSVPKGLFDQFDPLPTKIGTSVGLEVVFFDADSSFDFARLHDLVTSASVLNELKRATNSYEPKKHGPYSMPGERAAEYRRSVGDLYLSRQGVWSRSLVPFRRTLQAGMFAFLNEEPVVQVMRYVTE